MPDNLIIYVNKAYQHELQKEGAIGHLSGQHFILKDRDKVVAFFESHFDTDRLKDADQLIANGIRNADGKVYFTLASDVTMYVVSGSSVRERTLRPRGSLTDSFGAVTEKVSEETNGAVLSDLKRSTLLEKFNTGFAALKTSYGAGSSYDQEIRLSQTKNPDEKKEIMAQRNISTFFEKLERTLTEQIANGQRTELPNIKKFAVDRHLAELGKMQDHQMADKYIDTAVGIYTQRKLVER